MPKLTDSYKFSNAVLVLTVDDVSIEIEAGKVSLVKESYGDPDGPCTFTPKKIVLTLEGYLKTGEMGWDWRELETTIQERRNFQKIKVLKK